MSNASTDSNKALKQLPKSHLGVAELQSTASGAAITLCTPTDAAG